jgi:hypothetical protein
MLVKCGIAFLRIDRDYEKQRENSHYSGACCPNILI